MPTVVIHHLKQRKRISNQLKSLLRDVSANKQRLLHTAAVAWQSFSVLPRTQVKPELILTLPAQPVPYAVLGQPIHHSFSPAMQQAAFDHAGIEARYFRIEVNEEGLA